MKLTYLDLGTGHLSKQTMELLTRAGDRTQVAPETANWPAMTIANYVHGVFITVPAEIWQHEQEALPADLAKVLKYARKEGVDLIRFDADGDQDINLDVYIW